MTIRVDYLVMGLRKYFPNVLLIIDPNASQIPLIYTFSKYSNAYPVFWYIGTYHRVLHGMHVVRPLRHRFSFRGLAYLSPIFNPPHRVRIPYLPRPVRESIDLVFVSHPVICNLDLSQFRNSVKVYWAQDCLYDKTRYLELSMLLHSDYDYVFVDHKACVNIYREAVSAKVEWLPYAFYPEIHRPIKVKEDLDVSFIGGLTGIASDKRKRILNVIRSRRPQLRTFFSSAYLHHMVLIYNLSRVVLDISRIGELNWRVFEVLGCGRPLLRDYSSEVEELFKDRVHLVFYRDEEDLLDKLDWLLSDDEARARIASQGHREALEKHTMDHRITYLLKRVGLWEAGLGVDLGIPSGGSGSL